MLAASKPDAVHPGLAIVRESCDPDSLAEFGWALFQQWRTAGMPSRHDWALAGLGWIGDDRTARRLAPFILAWPGDGGHTKAVAGLAALDAAGVPAAARPPPPAGASGPTPGVDRRGGRCGHRVPRHRGRHVHTLTDEEHAASQLARFEGRTAPTGRVLGLTRRGWERAEPRDSGVEDWVSRTVAPGRCIVVSLTPGVVVGAPSASPEQTLSAVQLTRYRVPGSNPYLGTASACRRSWPT